MRESDWIITWDPEGVSPLLLLDLGDLMDREISLPQEQLVVSGRSDFSTSLTMIARQNAKRRLEFSRRLPHSTGLASWQAAVVALAAAPWAVKGTLRVEPRGGASRDYTAALMSSRHRPSLDGRYIESVHEYVFRITPI